MISPIDVMGSLVYRTREALNKNAAFLEKIKGYRYYDSVSDDGKVRLWHYPGTPEEISDKYLGMQDSEKSFLKYPAVFDYLNIPEQIGVTTGYKDVFFNLAFVAPTNKDWDSFTRKDRVFKMILYDIYEEFFNQIKKFDVGRRGKVVFNPSGEIPHKKYDVHTTGKSVTEVLEYKYCDYMDVIQIINLRLKIAAYICDEDTKSVEEESYKVFGNLMI
ncbi:MAG: hypothetical protein FWF53_04480 [Candidatus Azobacteroides sp.]|nr:hypothetical protein [Candidatus Azobacteroides sp.]